MPRYRSIYAHVVFSYVDSTQNDFSIYYTINEGLNDTSEHKNIDLKGPYQILFRKIATHIQHKTRIYELMTE